MTSENRLKRRAVSTARFFTPLALAVAMVPALAGGKDRTLDLRFIPQESTGGSSAYVPEALRNQPVALHFVDSRAIEDKLVVGDGTSDDDELFTWRASSSVEEFARDVFAKTTPGWGLRIDPASTTILTVRLLQFSVQERDQAVGSMYGAEVRVEGTLSDGADSKVAQATGFGDARRYGKPRSKDNCMEVLSDAMKEAYAALLGASDWSGAKNGPSEESAPTRGSISPEKLLGDLLKLKGEGVGDDVMLRFVGQKTLTSAFTVDDVLAWKKSGLNDSVINAAMARPTAESRD